MASNSYERVKLDRADQRILELLQVDGSLSNIELADKIGLSPSPCSRRVKALEDSGLIQGYRAHLDARRLGLDLLALIQISMDRHTTLTRIEGVSGVHSSFVMRKVLDRTAVAIPKFSRN